MVSRINFIPNEIVWGAYENWPWIGVFLALAAVLVYRCVRVKRAKRALASARPARSFMRHAPMVKMILKGFLQALSLAGLYVALLRPMWDKKEEIVEQEGRDVFIAIDISRSMLATDCIPDRLTCAKHKIKQLLPLLASERVGLILFAGSSIVQCPLTTDYSAFMMFLDQVDAQTISSGTTALDQAIRKAMEAFAAMPKRKNKLLVIFTDGEDFSSNLADVKAGALQSGLHIFTFGVGTIEGAPIPLFDIEGNQVGHQKDEKGNVVITRLNEGILQSVARESGSLYIRMAADDADLRTLVKALQGFHKERVEDKKIAMFEDQYHYFLLVTFVCLLLEWLL